MDEITYAARTSLATGELTYRLDGEALNWSGKGDQGRIAFADVDQVRLFDVPGARAPLMGAAVIAHPFTQVEIQPKRGNKRVIPSRHYRGLSNFEDRSEAYGPFADALVARIAAANPAARFLIGMPGAIWSFWLGVLILLALCELLVLLGAIELIRNGQIGWALFMSLAFLAVFGLTLRSTIRTVSRGRARPFDPRIAP